MPAPRTNRATGKPVTQLGDVTALRKQVLEEQRDADQADAAQHLAVAKEVEDYERKHQVIDYTGVDNPLPEVIEEDSNDGPFREIIIKYDIDQMSFGVKVIKEAQYDENGAMTVPPTITGINFLSFKEGRRYRVPRALADHLDERGFVFH